MSVNQSPMITDSTDVQKQFAHAVYQVNLAFRQFLQQKLKQYKFDLTFEMIQVLGQLWQGDGINQQEIANAIFKDKASITLLIDNLSRRGLVIRQEDTVDRRNKLVFLTEQGRQLQRVISWIKDMYLAATAGIPQEELEQAMRVLHKVTANLKVNQGFQPNQEGCGL